MNPNDIRAWWALIHELYVAFPDPVIAAVAMSLGAGFGIGVTQFAKISLWAFRRVSLGARKLKFYSGALAFGFGAVIAWQFEPAQGNIVRLILHSIAAGIAAPAVANVYIKKLEQANSQIAEAVREAYDLEETGEHDIGEKKCG